MEKRLMKTLTTSYFDIELQFAAYEDDNQFELQPLKQQHCFAPRVNTEYLYEAAELEAGGLLNCWGTAEFAWCWEYAMRNEQYLSMHEVILDLIKFQFFTKFPNAYRPRINRLAENIDLHRSKYQSYFAPNLHSYLPTRTEMLEKARWETNQNFMKGAMFGEAA